VPNTEEGRNFLALARKYLNREAYTIRPMGRGKNRHDKSYMPMQRCDWMALYVYDTPLLREQNRKYEEKYGHRR
jgi:hypothetical protein